MSRMDARVLSSALAVAALVAQPALAAELDDGGHAGKTATPIEHVIVIVGENHTFDNIYGAYRPAGGHRIWNLLSKRIINPDGTPGARFGRAAQQEAIDEQSDEYQLSPHRTGPYSFLPTPQTTYATGLPPGVPDSCYPADLPN